MLNARACVQVLAEAADPTHVHMGSVCTRVGAQQMHTGEAWSMHLVDASYIGDSSCLL